MKTNATTRIIIWSIVLVLLLGILFVGLFMRYGIVDFRRAETPVETVIPLLETFPANLTHTADRATPIYSSPSTKGNVVGELSQGETAAVIRHELVGGEKWALIESGWIHLDDDSTIYLIEPEAIDVPMQAAEPGEKYTVSADAIREISIEWVAGDILIQPGNVDAITFSEDDVTDEKYAMIWKQRGDELNISFCEESVGTYFGISTRSDIVKDLTILVPQNWICESLEINAASATVEINDMTIREMDFDGASGTCELENCTIGEMDVDTASGDITIIGSLDSLDCDAASASVYAVLSNIPSRLDMDSMSGDLDITLPEDAGFAVTMDGLDSDFSSDFETTVKNGSHVHGDGRCRINIDAMSGNVTIRKGEAAAPVSAEHHVHTDTCTTDPSSCPDNAEHHTHTEQCTTDPNTCPDNTEHHTHTEQCTTDPNTCPDNTEHHTHTEQCTTDPNTCPDSTTRHTGSNNRTHHPE